MCGCESWSVKKAECWRIDAFALWCWRRLLRVPWTARRYNQSILKEISPECSLEGLMLKLKLQYFGHLIRRTDSFEKTLLLGRLKAGRKGDDKGWDGWMASPTQWTWVWVNTGSWWWTGRFGVLQFMGLQSQTWLSDLTELSSFVIAFLSRSKCLLISWLQSPSAIILEPKKRKSITTSCIIALSWWKGLHNLMMLWAKPCRASQDKCIRAESSDKMWFTREGNGKPPQYTCCENLKTSIKGQKDMTPKISPPGLKVSNMLLGKSRGELLIATGRRKQLGQSRNDTHLWMCLIMKVKSDAAKNSIA